MHKIIMYFLWLLCISVVQAQPSDSSRITEIRIDPTYARTGAASLFFKSITFTPLQNTEESFVGRINKLVVTERHFVIHDRESDAISIFKKDGSFVTKIRRLPVEDKDRKARGEMIENFCVDFEANCILVSSWRARGKLFAYDFNGRFLDQYYYMPVKTGDFIRIGKDRLLTRPLLPFRYWTRNGTEVIPYEGHEPYSLLITARDSTVLQKLLPINLKKVPREDETIGHYYNFTYSGDPGKAFFRRFFDYHFFEVSANGIEKEYNLIFPMGKSLPPNFYSDSSRNRSLVKHTKGVIMALDEIFRVGDILSLAFWAFGPVHEVRGDLLYNQKTGNALYLGGVAADSMTMFLPPFGTSGNMLACDGLSFYSYLSSYTMHYFKDMLKNPSFNKVMDDYFKNSTSQSNPVIVQWVPKEDF